MTSLQNSDSSSALILHAGAIGDVVLGTLVPAEIKRARPELKVIYWTHESLFDLLRLCPFIDEFLVWNKRNPLMVQRGIVRGAQPEVFVDMSSSLRTRIISLVSGAKTLRYQKQSADARPIVHAAENFRATVMPWIGGEGAAGAGTTQTRAQFPTFAIAGEEANQVKTEKGIAPDAVAIVPGVGALRSHRAWAPENWAKLAARLTNEGTQVVLIGGPDDKGAADAVASSVSGNVLNLVGALSLRETAVALSLCSIAVSGDTGPSHIAAAVGTPVVGLLGPTYPQRSGPFGYVEQCFNACESCKCHSAKSCVVTGTPGAGSCMGTIDVAAVYERLRSLALTKSVQ